MEITNFGKKQFKEIELLTGSGRPKTNVLAGNDVLSGGAYRFKKFVSDAKTIEKAIPAPIKKAIVEEGMKALESAGKRKSKSKSKQGHLVKGSKEAKDRMEYLRSLRKK